MSIQFSADEILQMAQQIERNGIRFYRRAAQAQADSSSRRTLLKLADMEADHEKVFAGMRAGLSPEERAPITFDPDDELGLYLQAMADRRAFDMTADPAERLTGKETAAEVLRMGIQAEKDSIVFYLGMKEVVPARAGKSRVDEIIKEEMGHIATLTAMLAEELG